MTQWIITSSVLIVIIAVLRFVLRGKISLKLQYALWGLVLIRLLLPFSVFESPASVLNLLQKREETVDLPAIYEPYEPENVTPVTPVTPAFPDEDIFILDDNIGHIEPETNITVGEEDFVTEPEIRVISAKDIIIPIWIGGIAVFGAVFAVSNIRFSRKLKNTREYLNETKAWLPVYKSSAVKTPCLFGAIKPAIYVTEEVLKDEKTICHVLEHETTHYRHGDHIWSVLRCFCLALHWYNPLVWLAAFLSMRDSELACDEDTIKRIGEDERIGYGRTLINLTCEKPAVGILSAATTMTGSKSSIKERVLLIAKKPKMLWITAVLVVVVAIFAVGCTFTGAKDASEMKEDKKVVVESSIEGNENIVPVLYYEKGVGGPSYKTNTLLINDNKAFVMENHNRTFERTYPSSAYERFKENEAVYGEYGQLMVYYNSVFGEIFLFESYDERVFTIVKNNIKTEIYFNEGETYFDFLYFDGNYYLFTLTETSVLRTYKISENLEVEKPFDFKYGNIDIDKTVFIDNYVVIVGNNLVLTSEKDLVICNFETNVTKVLPMDYSVFGMVADKDCFYVISYSDLGEIVFEKFSPEGESLGKNEIFLPSGFNYSPWISRTDGTYYMYGSEIYMEFHTGGECYIFSYDVESEEWKNSWIVGKEKEPFSASNIKYMVMSGETYYDIFPHWSNKGNNNTNNDVVSEEVENNKAYWECAPAMSSKLPWFEFEFDFDFSLINVGVYATEGQGSLYDIHTGEDYNTLALKNGDFIRWAPYVGDSGLNFAQSATVNFVVYQNGDVYNYTHTGSLKIKQLASENGKTLYEATLISESLGLFQNEETGGGIIYIKPPEKVNAEYSEEEYKSAVKELGYTEDRLSYFEGLFDEGLSPLAVMDPIKYCKAFGETTWPYGLAYSLGSFYFDPEIYVDHGGPIGCVYIRNNLKDRKVEIVPEYVHNFARWGVLDSRDFYFGDFDGIRIYNIDDISKPSSVWNVPEEKLLNKNWKPIITSASSKGNGEVVVIWVNRPEDFDAPLRGNNLDKTNYMISVVDTEGNTVGDYDTGIKIKLTNGGMNDVVHPEIVATTKNKVLFKVKNVHYVFDYGKENPIAEQYIFTENDVVRYSNIDFDGEFAASAINEVIKLIENGYSENSEIESFNIRRAEIDEDATNREINLIGSGVKERYSPDDCMNRFLVVRTVTDENFKDGSSRERVIKYFLLYDPTNKYEHGQMLGNGWKRVDISKESFEIPEFDDDRFYSDFEKEGNKEPEYDEEYWINLVKNLEVKKVYKTEKAFPQVVGEIGYLMLEEEKIEVIKLQSVGVSGDENEFYANYLFITKDGMEFNLQVRMRKTDEGYGFLGGGFGGGYVTPLSYGLEKADIELIDILYSKE